MFAFFAYYSQNPATALRQTLDLMVQRAYWVMNNDVLISVPCSCSWVTCSSDPI